MLQGYHSGVEQRIPLGGAPLSLEDVHRVARGNRKVEWAPSAMERIERGRAALESLLASGERIYGVNTGVGGNLKYSLAPDQAELLQRNLMRHLSCATGQPLPDDVVRGAMLLRLATFATGCSGIRPRLCHALLDLLNAGITPVVPRYGSVGASGDLMPSAYIARALIGMGDVHFKDKRMPAAEAIPKAGLALITFAPKEGLALINGTTVMTSAAALMLIDAPLVLRALLRSLALSCEALEAPFEPFEPFVHEKKGHPGQIAVAAFMRAQWRDSAQRADAARQSCYSLRCVPQGLGPAWEAFEDSRAMVEREINSANDNPLIDPVEGRLYRAGNFYGGHIARALDAWKIDFAIIGNWANALMAVLVDDRFNSGLPANLVPEPGVNSGLKGMQLSVTSLACAIRQLAGPSSIHSLPTEQYNQDVVSLGMHAAVTALDALECLGNEVAMLMLASAQAVDLRGRAGQLGEGNAKTYQSIRELTRFLDRDRALEQDVAAIANRIRSGAFET
jgi:phenylalanine ammonia-lyase